MTASSDLASGKGHSDENFPVASFLLRPAHRPPIMAFYRFARAADDIADHESATPAEKLVLLAEMRAGLDGDGAPEAMALRDVMAARGLDPIHAHELLEAFVRDVTVDRYADWDDLIGYCRLSAIAGRPLRARRPWREPRDLARQRHALRGAADHQPPAGLRQGFQGTRPGYIPLDTGLDIDDLGGDHSTPTLRAIITALTQRTRGLLDQSAGFATMIRDRRLAAEVAAIQRLALSLCDRLEARDPLAGGRPPRQARGRMARRRRRHSDPVPARGMSTNANAAAAPASQAARSSFYAGMRVLPKAEREAMYAVYGFCRIVDDIADDQQGDRAQRMAALDRWRADLDALYAGGDPGQAGFLAEAVRRFGLDRADFEAVIDGMAMDVDRDICWPKTEELDLYCDRVASAVGRLSVRVFGMERERASASPTISAAPCSSPTSCATSTRTPRSAASIWPRRD